DIVQAYPATGFAPTHARQIEAQIAGQLPDGGWRRWHDARADRQGLRLRGDRFGWRLCGWFCFRLGCWSRRGRRLPWLSRGTRAGARLGERENDLTDRKLVTRFDGDTAYRARRRGRNGRDCLFVFQFQQGLAFFDAVPFLNQDANYSPGFSPLTQF